MTRTTHSLEEQIKTLQARLDNCFAYQIMRINQELRQKLSQIRKEKVK